MQTVRIPSYLAACVLLGSLSAFSVGCSEDTGPEKVGVSGMVTVDGQTVVDGKIMFVSLKGGRTCATSIKDGSYELRHGAGPFVGDQKVSILAFKKTGQTITVTKSLPGAVDEGAMIPPGGLKIEETTQILPARYNTASELKTTLVSGNNDDVFFDLTTEQTTVLPSGPPQRQ